MGDIEKAVKTDRPATRELRRAVGEHTLCEMARVGFVPVGASETAEVYVHTDDAGKVPHFHVRGYHAGGKGFDWEVCVKCLSDGYFREALVLNCQEKCIDKNKTTEIR